jgi:hypothetical protein
MINFYTIKNIRVRPIIEWSKRLDKLQKNKNYEEIIKCIINYIYLFSIDMMKYGDLYYCNILLKNIDRWNNLDEKNNLYNLVDPKYKKIVYLLKIYNKLLEKNNEGNKVINIENIFFDIDLIILMDDYYELFKLSLENNLTLPFDLLKEILDIRQLLKKYFDLDIDNNISGKKILKLYHKLNSN